MQRFNQRQGFLVSAVLHLTFLMMLIASPPTGRPPAAPPTRPGEVRERVFLPREALLRKLIPARPAPTMPPPAPPVPADRRPVPEPTQAEPEAPATKDRISIGAPSDRPRSSGPVELRRDEDLTNVARGALPQPTPPPRPAPEVPGRPGPAVSQGVEAIEERRGRAGPRLPAEPSEQVGHSGEEGQRGRAGRREVRDAPGSEEPFRPGTTLNHSARDAMDGISRRMSGVVRLGIPTGMGRELPVNLYFDPLGADFTLWIQRFKDELYRNWIVPQSVMLGAARGETALQFTVERDGDMSDIRLVRSAGTAALDRAAANALSSGRYLPLPDDYGPARLTAVIVFEYGAGGGGW